MSHFFFQFHIRFPGPTHTLTGLQYAEVWRLMSPGAYVNWHAVSLWSMRCFFYWLDNKIILTRQKCVCVNLFSPWKLNKSGVLVPMDNVAIYTGAIQPHLWNDVRSPSLCLFCLVNTSKPQKLTIKWLLCTDKQLY